MGPINGHCSNDGTDGCVVSETHLQFTSCYYLQPIQLVGSTNISISSYENVYLK